MGKVLSKPKTPAASSNRGRGSALQSDQYAGIIRWIQERLEATRTATPKQLAADKAEWEKFTKSMNADRTRAKRRRAF